LIQFASLEFLRQNDKLIVDVAEVRRFTRIVPVVVAVHRCRWRNLRDRFSGPGLTGMAQASRA
jgi:hypothetical protein